MRTNSYVARNLINFSITFENRAHLSPQNQKYLHIHKDLTGFKNLLDL